MEKLYVEHFCGFPALFCADLTWVKSCGFTFTLISADLVCITDCPKSDTEALRFKKEQIFMIFWHSCHISQGNLCFSHLKTYKSCGFKIHDPKFLRIWIWGRILRISECFRVIFADSLQDLRPQQIRRKSWTEVFIRLISTFFHTGWIILIFHPAKLHILGPSTNIGKINSNLGSFY